MLILHDTSEEKLEKLVEVSIRLNETLREYYPEAHKITPDRATLLWYALDQEITRRQNQIDRIVGMEEGIEEASLQEVSLELKKEYDEYNQLMEDIYDEELLPATMPDLLIKSVKKETMEMREINKKLRRAKEAMKEHV